MSANRIRFWREASKILEGGERFFLAVVAAHSEHSPGTAGAMMLVDAHGRALGTIGGGIMEREVIDRAKSLLRQDKFTPELHTLLHRSSGEGEKSGMICAGSQTNLYLLCTPKNDRDTVAALVQCLQEDLPGALTIDTGGIALDVDAASHHQPRYELRADGPLWRYTEQLLNDRRVAILGGGHCASALAPVMERLGYSVTVIYKGATQQQLAELRGPAITLHSVFDYNGAARLIDYPELTRAIIMTTDVTGDVAGLVALQPLSLPFIGVLGSAAKISIIRKKTANDMHEPLNESNLYAPVGLPIESHTPEEIAISIAAQLLAVEADLFRHVKSVRSEATAS